MRSGPQAIGEESVERSVGRSSRTVAKVDIAKTGGQRQVARRRPLILDIVLLLDIAIGNVMPRPKEVIPRRCAGYWPRAACNVGSRDSR